MNIGFPSEVPSTEITASLRRDHEIIKKVLKATETCTKMLREGKTIPSSILLDTVDFITTFVDKCHHVKEEKGLFAALESTGLPRDAGPIAVMLREHEQARILAERIKESVNKFIENSNDQTRAALVGECEMYVELLKTHLLKEDTRLFVIAEMRLKGSEETVSGSIQGLEKETLGAGVETYKSKADAILDASEKSSK